MPHAAVAIRISKVGSSVKVSVFIFFLCCKKSSIIPWRLAPNPHGILDSTS
ncbi:unnamed protein product [Amoebophrya sp. A120]|nr:unnamed protein product [Amoebophrya sp. A120]|eukprot:GSA120T00025537001.1